MLVLVAALALFVQPAAPAQASSPPPAPATAVAAPAEPQVCVMEQQTGSMFEKKECHTRAEWKAMEAEQARSPQSWAPPSPPGMSAVGR